jgi:hypothetical protein
MLFSAATTVRRITLRGMEKVAQIVYLLNVKEKITYDVDVWMGGKYCVYFVNKRFKLSTVFHRLQMGSKIFQNAAINFRIT